MLDVTGTFGPETQTTGMDLDHTATSGSESFEMVSEATVSDTEPMSGLEAACGVEPNSPPKFSAKVKIVDGEKVFKLLVPHEGLEVDDRTRKLLVKMEQHEVEELLRPLTYTEPNLEGTHRVVEHCWLARVQKKQEAVWASLGRRPRSHEQKAGVAWSQEPSHWVGHTAANWVCTRCSLPRSWNSDKVIACLACKSKDPPVLASPPSLQLLEVRKLGTLRSLMALLSGVWSPPN